MNITILSRIVTLLTALLITLSTLLFLQNHHYIPPVRTLYITWYHQLFSHEINSLHTLYAAETDKSVTIAIPLDHEVIKRTIDGIKDHLNTVLEIEKVDGKIVKYILQTEKDNKQLFTLDPKSGKLQGTFTTFKHTAHDGTIIIKLIPVDPHLVKGS